MSDKRNLVRCEVTGELPIRDAVTRESVRKGETVQLDADVTIIDALVQAGSVKVLTDKATKKD